MGFADELRHISEQNKSHKAQDKHRIMVSTPSEEKRRQRRYAIYATIFATGFTAFLAIVFIDEGIIPQDYLAYIVAFWAMLWIIVNFTASFVTAVRIEKVNGMLTGNP